MQFDYVRVSTNTQNPNLQIDALLKDDVNDIYRDVSSGRIRSYLQLLIVQ